MQAVILAAGLGSRLKKLTENHTKSMVEVNGVSLIERMLRILDKKNLTKIVIVTGYKSDFFVNYIKSLKLNTKLTYINNEIYNKTNNIYSMYLAKEEMVNDDSILLESDLIFEEQIINDILNDPRENLALVDKYERWMDGTCLKINEKEEITDFVPGKLFDFNDADNYYKTINIYKFSKTFSKDIYFPFLEAFMSANGRNDYYETVLKIIIDLGKNHIIVEEIFDTDAEKSELEYFCKKYYTEWVTFFRFDGTIMQQRAFKGVPQFETILKKVPELGLEKRYNEWPGIKTEFIVYKLEESNKKGYALIKAQMFEKVINPDDIETRLIEYIRESIDKESFTKEGYLIHNGFIDIIFDKEFVEIIQNRYLNQIKDIEKNIRYQIPDLIKYTIEDYTKEKDSIDILIKFIIKNL